MISSRCPKKIGLMLLAIGLAGTLLLATLAVTARAQTHRATNSTYVWLDGPSSPLYAGDQVTVTVRVSDVVDLYGAQFSVEFITSTLQVIDDIPAVPGIQITSLDCPAPDFVTANEADNDNGTIEYAVTQLSPRPPVSGDCSMARIRFQTQTSGNTDLLFGELLLADSNGLEIPATHVGLTLNILPPLPTATFAATPTAGVAPLSVSFTNLSTGDIDSCYWTFGDGYAYSRCAAVSHTYSEAGTYHPSLEVNGPGGTDTYTLPTGIEVYQAVGAEFIADPRVGPAPLSVQFANLATGDFDVCTWSFGDGASSEHCGDPMHVYQAPGSYSVTLEVTGPSGNAIETKPDYISVMTDTHALYLPVLFRE